MLANGHQAEGDTVARVCYVPELACAFVSATLVALTLAVHDWIEVVFGGYPDDGSGLGLVAIVAALSVISVALTSEVSRLRRLERARA